MSKRANRAKKRDPFIGHHFQRYHGQIPIWVLTEVLDFADVSKAYKGLQPADRDEIARAVGIISALGRKGARPGELLANLLENLTVVRNIAAHHSRLWNRRVVPIGTGRLAAMDSFRGLKAPQDETVYASICAAGHLLQAISPGSAWTKQLSTLVRGRLEPIGGRSAAEMGFPDEWQTLPLWSGPTI